MRLTTLRIQRYCMISTIPSSLQAKVVQTQIKMDSDELRNSLKPLPHVGRMTTIREDDVTSHRLPSSTPKDRFHFSFVGPRVHLNVLKHANFVSINTNQHLNWPNAPSKPCKTRHAGSAQPMLAVYTSSILENSISHSENRELTAQLSSSSLNH